MTTVKLTGMQRVVASLYFERGLCQREIAAELRLTRWAVWCRLQRVAKRYRKRGLQPPPRPGTNLRTVTPQSLSGFWDGREYAPSNN